MPSQCFMVSPNLPPPPHPYGNLLVLPVSPFATIPSSYGMLDSHIVPNGRFHLLLSTDSHPINFLELIKVLGAGTARGREEGSL